MLTGLKEELAMDAKNQVNEAGIMRNKQMNGMEK